MRECEHPRLAGVLGFGTSAAGVGGIGVTRKFDDLVVGQAEGLLESGTNLHEDLATLLGSPAFATCSVAVSASWEGFSDTLGPQTDTVETLADVDYYSHDLAVVFVLKCLANSGEHDVQPHLVDVDGLLVFELECPFSTVLVLGVFPFRADAFLEEMVVRLLRKFGGRGDVVL